ncbi:TPA: hypothetical protein VDT85_005694 [Pseudomonas aeruginosa]|uniref:hypothetical protein n=1 Tax=Pseudomonas aeruginosa TaxID=287 RepID=UPI000CF72524|nr:hypothetical protein [Pseudomonas aeruginosa]MBI7367348.1 hypothetical protein [Pseudomonas aeruginosa]NPS71892.1 hypothetical protein [Pseudomonas aeruginosa]PQM07503.1 hypothetical protein C5F85_30295 [Pseudomonas aeruginosa]TEE70860.1 hypothetical protein IPC1499_00015 [Pseudomonas aeruginosa]HEJ1395043.1 hypothetical protein [Pseudomonas aeruginosa]
MAVRKKSETIHLRVQPLSKLLLEGLANVANTTSTRIIEDLILEAAKEAKVVDVNDIIDDRLLKNGKLSLIDALTAAYHPEPILTKLRIYYLADDALSYREEVIARSILDHPEFFSGDQEVFSAKEKIIKEKYFHEVPRISLERIAESINLLESFAAFKEKNPKLITVYREFLKMMEPD